MYKKGQLLVHENPNSLFNRAPSKSFPGETTLACPAQDCGSTDIIMVGKNLRGEGPAYVECRACKFRILEKSK